MKVTATPRDKVFQPVDITFTLETQAELDALGCCLNSDYVTYALGAISNSVGWCTAYQTFQRLGANLEMTDSFNKTLEE